MLELQLTCSEVADPPQSFSIDVSPDRERAIVAPHGELDLATVGLLPATVDELVDDGWAALVLDLRNLSFIDSVGLTFMIRQASREDARVAIVDGNEAVSRLFDTAGVRDLLPFVQPRSAWRRS
jgi:anti-anti-sigma factor